LWIENPFSNFFMTNFSKYSLILVTWMAALLRWPALFANRFHADEALFASWARSIAVWRDPLLHLQPVDKPPLLFYLQALFYPLFGPVEMAARLPNLIASLLLVPLVGALVWRWYRREKTAVFAAFFIALSPLHIQFSATAFTDPLLTTFLVASLVVLPERPGWAGIWFGLAAATKHQAWLYLPLFAGTAVLHQWPIRSWARWCAGLLPLLAAVWGWEAARTGQFTLWSQQMQNFGGIRLIWSWELLPRLRSWLEQLHSILGNGTLFAILLLMFWLIFKKPGRNYKYRLDCWLALFTVSYLVLHWILAVPVWDRYLLPLAPIVALLVGRFLDDLISKYGFFNAEPQRRKEITFVPLRLSVHFLALVLLVFMLHGGWQARNGRYPIGGSSTADQGAAEIAEMLADVPFGTVLYDHWFSWQWRYHLFDSRVFVSWFPHPQALITDLTAFIDENDIRYLVLPDSDQAVPVLRTVTDAGFVLEIVPTTAESGMILYRIAAN
jgi:4-amino-4-deoxy-L-arabinose transferase-like glycosyltransferase